MNLPVGLHNTGSLSHLFGIWSEMNGNKAFCSLLLLLCKTLALVVPVQVFIFPNYCSAGATYQEVQGIMLCDLPESRNCRQGSGKTCSTFLPIGTILQVHQCCESGSSSVFLKNFCSGSRKNFRIRIRHQLFKHV